ncbi:16S rRNA methyltransferase [Candidatus Phytoplasma luffae]|uniref:Ribosomal RNA small subunit methyltransferase G n=1 Tax=Loofah witches'-broom phytoplasma TaxID=35773 RepID=A0A975FIR1_LOWBP|nr:16S rRNA (guanine(527)-N(7))-methyltransferase RsmG [Candidatus Phytoplasma luffae]QTX03228.1 16S rRNA methyltransferase [Candidatus Phytoplasma luffae]
MLFNELLKKEFNLTEKQLQQFEQYYLFLVEYNKKINLTSLLTKRDIFIKHFYDSLFISRIMDFKKINNLCDLGTGAGFPGVPLKILYPNLKVFLIESSSKKVIFLNYLIKHLNLLDVFVIQDRIEKHSQKYNCVIVRALGKLNLILKLASTVTKNKGYFIAMKGPNYIEEFKNISDMYRFKLKNKLFLDLPNDMGKRINLLFQKQ